MSLREVRNDRPQTNALQRSAVQPPVSGSTKAGGGRSGSELPIQPPISGMDAGEPPGLDTGPSGETHSGTTPTSPFIVRGGESQPSTETTSQTGAGGEHTSGGQGGGGCLQGKSPEEVGAKLVDVLYTNLSQLLPLLQS